MIAGCGAVEYIAEIRWSVSVQQSCQHGFIRNCNHEFLQQMQLLFRIFQRQDKNEMDINVLILLRAAAPVNSSSRDAVCINIPSAEPDIKNTRKTRSDIPFSLFFP